MLCNLLRSDLTRSTNIIRYLTKLKAHEIALIGEGQQCMPHSLLLYMDQLAIGQGEVFNVLCGDYDTLDSTGLREYIHFVDLTQVNSNVLQLISQTAEFSDTNCSTSIGYSVFNVVRDFERYNASISAGAASSQ
jgi:UDP-glucose 4-epimerase